MPTMTIEAIRENPWNAVDHELPEVADRLLLDVAYRAAVYCMTSEYELMNAARAGEYMPAGWYASDCPDVHEESEDQWLRARERSEAISVRHWEQFGDFLHCN